MTSLLILNLMSFTHLASAAGHGPAWSCWAEGTEHRTIFHRTERVRGDGASEFEARNKAVAFCRSSNLDHCEIRDCEQNN